MKVPQCSRNVSSEADSAMSGVWDVAWRLEDGNVYSVVGRGSGESIVCRKQRPSSVYLESPRASNVSDLQYVLNRNTYRIYADPSHFASFFLISHPQIHGDG